MRRRHAISPVSSSHYQNLGIPSLEWDNFGHDLVLGVGCCSCDCDKATRKIWWINRDQTRWSESLLMLWQISRMEPGRYPIHPEGLVARAHAHHDPDTRTSASDGGSRLR